MGQKPEIIEIMPQNEQTKNAMNRSDSAVQKVYCARDKSLTHRAIIFASLAKGTSKIHKPLWGEDCQATANAFHALGVGVERSERDNVLKITSQGVDGFSRKHVHIDCGNSGTTARLLTGLFASVPGLQATLTGDESLSLRPMDRVVNPLRQMNAKIESHTDDLLLPLSMEGQDLTVSSHRIDKASAQVKSALLLAGCQIDGVMEISLPKGSRNHTELFMQQMGARCRTSFDEGQEFIAFSGPWVPPAFERSIPVDPSSAAFFVVWNLLHPDQRLVLPELLSNDGRLGFLRVLKRMGLEFQTRSSKTNEVFIEDVIDLHLLPPSQLRGVLVDAQEVPEIIDELPILAVAAAFADSASEFHGLRELRIKESDRLKKTWELLVAAGAEASIRGDSLYIEGGLKQTQTFQFDPSHDHRLAMAAAILATRAKEPCTIKSPECVKVSFPDFFDVLTSLPQV